MEKQYKCQLYDEDSFIDCLYVVFCQSYLIKAIERYMAGKGFDSQNKPHVLEIGCYTGRLRTFITQQRIFVDYTGVDVRQDYIDNHRLGNRASVKMMCEDATEHISLEDDSVDVCVCSEVIEHIDAGKHISFLKNIWRVLKENGQLVIGFPMNTENKQFHSVEKEKAMGHVNFPVHEEFIKLAEKCGFKVVRYDSSYSVKSSYRLTNAQKETELYKKLVERLGSPVARSIMMTLEDDHTGGGIYTLEKISQ